MADVQHQGLSELPPTPPTNLLPKGAWKLTPELIAEVQPYLSFDLAKVVLQPGGDKSVGGNKFIIRGVAPDQRSAAVNKDVTGDYVAILKQLKSRDNTSIFGTAGQVAYDSASTAYHDVYGGKDMEKGGSAMFRPSQPASFDSTGISFDAAGNPIARPQAEWGRPAWMGPITAATNPNSVGKPTFAQAQARQFQIEHPGYFQLGEDPSQHGSYDRGRLATNELPANYFPGGRGDPNELVKFDPKYGYIAPIAVQKQNTNDFLSKYGQYIPIALFGAGVAASAIAGSATAGSSGAAGSAGAAGGTFNGIGAGSTTGSLGLSSAGATGTATGSTLAGGTGIAGGISTAGSSAAAGFGIPAGGYAGAGITAAGQYTSGAAGNSAGTAQQAGSQGLFSQPAAPVSTGVPSSTGAGTGAAPAGGGLFGGGSSGGLLGAAGSAIGGGGGYSGLITSLIGAGLSAYQANQMAKSLEVQDKSTDYSKTSGGHTSFDPSIRGLQDQSLGRTAALESGVMGYGTTFRARSDENKAQYDDLYRELTSNQNPFIQARVDPLKEQMAGSRGQIQRNQGLRGVSGSSFGNDELTNFDFGAQRQLGDAGALATHDALGARGNTLGSLSSLNQNRLSGDTQLTNSLNTLNTNRTGIANDRALLERAGLGLSAQSEAAGRLSEQQKQEMYGRLIAGLTGG